MHIKPHIPNFITLLNLLCGCVAIVFISDNDFEMAFHFVCLGIFLDFFDGFFARLFNVADPLGLQLDSLADMVTSGVVPGYVMFWMLKQVQNPADANFIIPYAGFIITLGSCYRLAKFNIDTRQTDSFIGLPTPANTLFIMSFPLIIKYSDSMAVFDILTNERFLLSITLFSAYILNAEIPLFSLKVKDFSVNKNVLQIVFLSLCVLLLFFLQYLAIPLIIVSYVLLSVINNKFFRKQD